MIVKNQLIAEFGKCEKSEITNKAIALINERVDSSNQIEEPKILISELINLYLECIRLEKAPLVKNVEQLLLSTVREVVDSLFKQKASQNLAALDSLCDLLTKFDESIISEELYVPIKNLIIESINRIREHMRTIKNNDLEEKLSDSWAFYRKGQTELRDLNFSKAKDCFLSCLERSPDRKLITLASKGMLAIATLTFKIAEQLIEESKEGNNEMTTLLLNIALKCLDAVYNNGDADKNAITKYKTAIAGLLKGLGKEEDAESSSFEQKDSESKARPASLSLTYR